MSIARKVRSVERLFGRLETEIENLRKETGIHCIAGCGRCCTKPDIEASPLEFLPLAFEYFRKGQAAALLENLESETSQICILFSPLSLTSTQAGGCSDYMHRGLICRLFGFAAARDKYQQLRLVTCKEIKTQQPGEVALVNQKIGKGEKIPVFTHYYQAMSSIDFRLANQFVPINEAIKIALQEVMHYYAYRPFRASRKTA